jgi:hypothetical protein
MSRRIENTCSVEAVSSAPVGSSATMISGRLESARNGDALALTAGELVGTLVRVLFKSERAEQGKAALAHLGFRHNARGTHRQQHIVERGELRQQELKLGTQSRIWLGGHRPGPKC